MDPSNPLVSVIIPVYNTGAPAISLLDDIASNTYKNLEIIIVDDGSTDNSIKIIEKHLKTHQIFSKNKISTRLIKQPNSGPSSARNAGINISQGEYIIFLDSDDSIKKNHIETLVLAIKKPHTDLAISGVKFNYLNSDSISYYGVKPIKKQGKNENRTNFILRMLLKDGRFYGPTNKIYRREIIQHNHLRFDEKINFAEDLKFNLSYQIYASGDIKFTKKPTYIYNFGTNTSVVRSSSILKSNWQKSFDNLKEFTKLMSAKNTKHCSVFLQNIITKVYLLLIFFRWKISHASAVLRHQKNLKFRLKYASPLFIFLAALLIKSRHILHKVKKVVKS